MRILAIDTALAACAVVLFDAERDEMLARETMPMVRGHAEALVPMIGRVMKAAGLLFPQIDRVAVTVGPGSFTGLRVGISAARGIALAAGKPAVGLSTLSAFAAPHVTTASDTVILAAIDAAHGNAYFQIFGRRGRTLVTPRIAPLGEAAAAAVAAVRNRAGKTAEFLIVGSAAPLVAASWPAEAALPAVMQQGAPDIEWVARLGAASQDADTAPKPLYLRAPDAKPQERSRLPRR